MRVIRALFISAAGLLTATGCATCPPPAMEGIVLDPPSDPVQTLYEPRSDTESITIIDLTIRDEERARPIPLRIWLPEGGNASPVVLFSPGLGRDREDYGWLAESWARAGYAVVQMQHVDSDDSMNPLLQIRAAFDPQVWRDRPLDVSAVLDALGSSPSPELEGRLDLDRVAAAGHSYGAFTVMIAAGGLLMDATGRPQNLGEDRLDAIVAISTPKNRGYSTREAYDPIRVPVLHMTGTRDAIPLFRSYPCHRRRGFEKIVNAPQMMVTIDGARHRDFSDGARSAEHERSRTRAITIATTTSFLDSVLRRDTRALHWLSRAALPDAEFERKDDLAGDGWWTRDSESLGSGSR